jgi:hypothetical protein
MTKRWSIKINSLVCTMEFSFTGFWSVDEAEQWRKEYKVHVDRIAEECAGKFYFLVDFTSYPAQRQEVANIHGECMAYGRSKGLTKAAHIVPDVIVKMQMDKLNKRVDNTLFENFLTRAEAEAWLRS